MKNVCNYNIQLLLPPGEETAAVVGAKFLRTLDDLGRIDPVFGGWELWEDMKKVSIPIEQARRTMTTLVELNVVRDDYDEPDLDDGYMLIATNSAVGDGRQIGVTITAGGKSWLNDAKVQIGSRRLPPDASIITYPILKSALLVLTSIWPCPWARVLGSQPDGETVTVSVAGFSSTYEGQRRMTWMGYLSAEGAEGLEAPADLMAERTSDGGLLLIASEERPDPSNAAQMRRCDALAAIMDGRTGIPWLEPS